MPILPIALFGLGLFAWQWLTDRREPSMVGADSSGAFGAYPQGCVGEPLVKAYTVPGVEHPYRISIWTCDGTPYTHYVVAQEHLSPNWVGFKAYPKGKRKFWRGNGSANDIVRNCIALGVVR